LSKVKHLDGYNRFDLTKLLPDGADFIGIELGVAAGEYSSKMAESGKFSTFWGVDMYADTHDTAQYKQALLNVGIDKNYKLLRMTFDEALDLFPDHYFDFMYLDGYAGNGFEGGQTLRKWAGKVKVGGIIAGDDYHNECPLLKSIVDEFVEQNELELMTTEGAFDFSAYGHYPSWAVCKTKEVIGETSSDLKRRGIDAANKSKKKKKNAKFADQIIRKLLPTQTYDNVREWNRLRKKQRRIEKAKRRERNTQ
jgi:hypothetical protein